MNDIPRLLKQFGLRPKKSLGQNFLVDEQALDQIVRAAEVNLGNRTERATPADAHLVPALYLPFDLPFHRQAALKCDFELLIVRGRSRQPSGERQPT